jgi:hypothetical protein
MTTSFAVDAGVSHTQTKPPIFKNQELTIEEVIALYFNHDSIVAQPEPVYRLDSPKAKFYYTFDRINYRPEYFMAVTSFLAKVMPVAPQVVEKMIDLGKHAFNSYKNERALYGTMMDMEFNRFLIEGKYDMDAIPEVLAAHHAKLGSQVSLSEWIEEFNTDITAFAQWVHDYDVKPLAIGIMLVSRNLGIGGQLDLVCEMNDMLYTEKTPVSQRKRVRRVIDNKSGKNGFYESHILQVKAYGLIWDENFPEYPIDGIANFAPKKWLKGPSYDFKDHSDNPVCNKLEHYIEIARIDNLTPNRYIKMFNGQLTVGEPVTNQYVNVELDKFITEKMLNRL